MSDQSTWNLCTQQPYPGPGNRCGYSTQLSRRHRKWHWAQNCLADIGAAVVVLGSLTMAGAVPAAAAAGVRLASVLQAATPTPAQVLDGPACPDVMVIAARGTNEAPSNTESQTASAYTTDQYHGAGQTLFTMYGELKSANPNLTFSLDPVVYATAAPHGNSLLVLAESTAQYLGDASDGADNISDVIQATDLVCGHTVHYILAGYSLGAWAVHDALNQLSPAQLGEIVGVALFGDPKFQPGQPFVRAFKSQDTYHGVAYYAIQQADNTIPDAIVPQTGSWCLPADPFCQFQYNHLLTWSNELQSCLNKSAACAHFQYATDGLTVSAASFLGPFLPAASLWPQLTSATPPDGTVGTGYTWTAAVTPAGTYTWTSSGTPPPGLSFSSAGVLSGIPTQAGTSTFSITATGSYGRFVTGQVTVTINPPSGGSGFAYVASGQDGTMIPISIATNTAGTPITVGSYPSDIVITPDGSTAYVANGGDGLGDGMVTPVNLVTGAVGTPIPVGNGPLGIAITPNGATVYVTDWEGDTVTPISTATNTAGTPIPVGDSPYEIAITPDGDTAYVANCGSNTVTPISTATNTAGTPIPVGNCPEGIAITPNGSTAYVTNSIDGTVTPIDLATGAAGTPIPVGKYPWGIAITPNGATAYVCDWGSATVTPIDLATGAAGTPIPVGEAPRGIAITSDGALAYVTNEQDGTVTPINLATNTPGTAIPLGSSSNLGGIAITPGST